MVSSVILEGTFAKYHWKPARIIRKAAGANIISITSKPTIVGRAPVENATRDIDPFEAHYQIHDKIMNRLKRTAHWTVSTTTWESVNYEIGIDKSSKEGGESGMSVTGTYGESESHEREVEVGAMASGTVPLHPGQKGVVELSASRGTIKASVNYQQTLSGGVFYHFGKRVDGHYLYYVPLGKLFPTKMLHAIQNETLEIELYSEMGVKLVEA